MQTNPLKEDKVEYRAMSWLADKGFQIVKRNWAFCHSKVDIIASRLGRLHFIGIATRSAEGDPFIPGECITRRKMLSFLQASRQYLQRNPEWKDAMIDILTVTMAGEEPRDCMLTRNVRLL
jgi:putative endonuclease